ncbi:DUF4888 domain-containing protein, partial [Salmonella enterica subsp. enterica serovar Corvallis]|nr:DUF4888 domain-containing protein [Salmonella enterica subsp. enterica serovar Corvallis]
IDLTKENVYDDFNKKLDAKNTWNSLTEKLKGLGLLQNGQKVSIYSRNIILRNSNRSFYW